MKKLIVVSLLAALFALGCSNAEAPSPLALSDHVLMQESNSALYRSTYTSDFEGESNEFTHLRNLERKLVKEAYVRIKVGSLNRADAHISSLISKYNAHTASTHAEENIYAYLIRVPSAHYDAFMAEMGGVGRLLNRTERTLDVTLHYYDLEGRLETKNELLKTFQSYLARARTIEEILAVEERIAMLQFDIDMTGSQFRQLENKVDYATINLTLLGPPALFTHDQGETFGQLIKQIISYFGIFFFTIFLIIVGLFVCGVPVILIFIFVVWLLFGRVGLVKKLWTYIMSPKTKMRNVNE